MENNFSDSEREFLKWLSLAVTSDRANEITNSYREINELLIKNKVLLGPLVNVTSTEQIRTILRQKFSFLTNEKLRNTAISLLTFYRAYLKEKGIKAPPSKNTQVKSPVQNILIPSDRTSSRKTKRTVIETSTKDIPHKTEVPMEQKQLDVLADRLLDTGKRNGLINFKDTKSSTAEILSPSSAELFRMLAEEEGGLTFEAFDPGHAEQDAVSADAFVNKTTYRAKYSNKLKHGQLLFYNASGKPLAALKQIAKRAQSFLDETGINVVYLAFGFIKWTESESSQYTFLAPALLVPVTIERGSVIDPILIKPTDDEIIPNPTFSYKLQAEYGISLPKYDGESLDAYLVEVAQQLSRLNWSVSNECKIGIFSFQKINMYEDIKNNAPKIMANKNIRTLFGVSGAVSGASFQTATKIPTNPITELHNIYDADSSQLDAIIMAKTGQSFVIQGPPGTGKSQTITNIIAECLYDDKKVLFVSEKQAALNVVYEKLRKARLSEFCLELHAHKANKKSVIADLCHTLKLERSRVSMRARSEIQAEERAQKQLDAYERELHLRRPVIEKSLYELYEAYSAVHDAPDVQWSVPGLTSKGEVYLQDVCALLEQYMSYIPTIGYNYQNNVWREALSHSLSYAEKRDLENALGVAGRLFEKLIKLGQELSDRYQISCVTLEDFNVAEKFLTFFCESDVINYALLTPGSCETILPLVELLRNTAEEIAKRTATLEHSFKKDIYNVDAKALYTTLKETYSGIFSRLFNQEYASLIEDLRQTKIDGIKPSYTEALTTAQKLLELQAQRQKFFDIEQTLTPYMGAAWHGLDSNWNHLIDQLQEIKIKLQSLDARAFTSVEQLDDLAAEKEHMRLYLSVLKDLRTSQYTEALTTIGSCFLTKILSPIKDDIHRSYERCNYYLKNFSLLNDWSLFSQLLAKLEESKVLSFIDEAVSDHTHIKETEFSRSFKKLFLGQWIDYIISESKVLSDFSRISQDQTVKTFVEKDKEHVNISIAQIREKLSGARPPLDMVVPKSPAAIILREGEKKRKQKSIRTLLAETGGFIQKIKPCFMMSPLSVSTFLANDSIHFDVVIFDEASQIFPQDAIGSMYRADQMIVVGDAKQMPPSNFFNSSTETDDEDEEEDIGDFESILDLCSTSFVQKRLSWHYRSRYEQLIAFSNKNFYDNTLITFPSSKKDVPEIGVDYTHINGVYDRKSHTNLEEAKYVVELIFKNARKYPKRSLGVVAFSMAQQNLIDKLLTERRLKTPNLEPFFSASNPEPFFIKNLETVQGDERDTIIFSIAYGADAQGRLLLNFGPLNKKGGERRLNVAVSRAKENVQLVSSMHYTDIDLARTESEGARLLREYLDYAENGTIALERSLTAFAYDHYDSDFELEVCEFLRDHDYSVDTQVGCSGFKIDLGLKHPKSSDYVLAIECDGASYHSCKNARDRDRLRQEILEGMGWQFYRIWSTDWFHNKSTEKRQLLLAADRALQSYRPAQNSSANPRSPLFAKTAPANSMHMRPVASAPTNSVAAGSRGAATNSDQTPSFSFEAASAFDLTITFKPYKAADVDRLMRTYGVNKLKDLVREILIKESPLSEELLLQRIVGVFGRQKVTSAVKKEYEQKMRYCEKVQIRRIQGFLYLNIPEKEEAALRVPGDLKREIKHIAPKELAAGMLELLKQNDAVETHELFLFITKKCGWAKVTKGINEHLTNALGVLKRNIVISNSTVRLKEDCKDLKLTYLETS